MQTPQKVLIGIAIVAVLGLGAWLSLTQGRDQGIPVRTEVIGRHDLVEIVTASGNIRARRTVDISSDVSARVQELLIDEGDDVRRGQTLLRLDPTQYQAAAARSRASLAQAQAQRSQQEANLIRAQRDLDRLLALRTRDSLLVSRQQVADPLAQAHAESQEHDQGFTHRGQGDGPPITQVDPEVAAQHRTALPSEYGEVGVHGVASAARARNRSSSVGGRTS
jgi:multidrug efflux pump subunit AcrA (membrane-fusion protein)